MSVVQVFEKALGTDERLAALAAAMNRLPAGAVVRRLTSPEATASGATAPGVTAAGSCAAENIARGGTAPDPDTVPGSDIAAPAAVPGGIPDAAPFKAAPFKAVPFEAGAPRTAIPETTTHAAASLGGIASVQSPPAAQPATAIPAPDPDTIPVPEPLSGLLPGGLRRGEAAALATRDKGPDYLALALLAEALKAGLWCAVVGVPELGLAALAGLLGPAARRQDALDRLILVAEPAQQWAEVTATLADGVDLLLARPATPVRAETAQRVDARLRQGRSTGTRHSAALLVLGGWPTARLVLRIARTDWTGLDGIGPTAGTGHLTAGRATVVAQGRATAGRPRVARLWLPDATGAVRSLSDNPGTVPGRPSRKGLDGPALTLLPPAAPSTDAAASPAA